MRMRRQTASEVDAPAVKELAGGHSDEYRRITVLSNADRRDSLRSFSRQVFLVSASNSIHKHCIRDQAVFWIGALLR
jgi:hypothetical protein